MKKISLVIGFVFLFSSLQAQWGDEDGWGSWGSTNDTIPPYNETFTSDSVDESSYLDSSAAFVVHRYLLKEADEKKFWEAYFKRFNISDLNTDYQPFVNNFRSTLPKPFELKSDAIVQHTLDFSKIIDRLAIEMATFKEKPWQLILNFNFKDNSLRTIDRKKLKEICLMDSLIGSYKLLPGYSEDDPEAYRLVFTKTCMMKPYDLYFQLQGNNAVIELRCTQQPAQSLFLEANDLGLNLEGLKAFLNNPYFLNFLMEQDKTDFPLESQNCMKVIDDFLNYNVFYSFDADDFNWIYFLEDGRLLLPPMDIHEFEYNGANLDYIMEIIPGMEMDLDDPANYETVSVITKGELQSFGTLTRDEVDGGLSLIFSNKRVKSGLIKALIGISFNNRNVIFFEDSKTKISQQKIDLLLMLNNIVQKIY